MPAPDGLWPVAFCLGDQPWAFESISMAVKDVSARWMKASNALKKEDQISGQMITEMDKKHLSQAFQALEYPLEAAMFFGTGGDD